LNKRKKLDMKRLLFVLFVLSGGWLFGQEESQEFKTIVGKGIESGGWGAPEFKVSQVNNKTSLLLGGKGGWVINHKFVIGAAGYGMTSNNTFDYTEDLEDLDGNLVLDSTRTLDLSMGYGGVFFEYVMSPKKLFHLTFPLLIGAGRSRIKTKTFFDANVVDPEDWTQYDYVESTGFFVLEPGVNIELNMTKVFRLDLGVSYRYISCTDLQRLSNNDLSDFSFNLGLKFGKF